MINILECYKPLFSDSDKENPKNNQDTSQNATDIRAHELIIENAVNSCPKYDDSINKMFQNILLLNNSQQNSSHGSGKKTYRNRLTNNFYSPLLKTSPLSSTPFTHKNRSESIYKFSPIRMGDLEDVQNYMTVKEENEPNQSIKFSSKPIDNESKFLANAGSPKTHTLPDNVSVVKRHSNPLFSHDDTNSKNSVEKSHTDNLRSNEIGASKVQMVSLQTSESDPFIGFSESIIAKAANEVITEEKDESLLLPCPKGLKGKQKSKDCSSVEKNTSQDIHHIPTDENNHSIQHSMPVQPFLDVSKVDVDYNLSSDENYKNTDFKDDDNNASSIKEHTLDCTKTEFDANSEQDTDSEESLCVSLSDDSESGHSAPDIFERDSLYNTCNSEQSFKDDVVEVIKYPVVTLERINSSLLNKCLARMPKYASSLNDNTDSSKSGKEFDSFETSYDNSDDLQSEINEFEIDGNVDTKEDIEQSVCKLSETTLNSEVSETIQEEEEECISFVNTRRRNERIKHSTIFVLNDSIDSSSYAEFDKTVFSNKIELENNSSDVNIINEKTDCLEVKDAMLDNEKYKKTEANVKASGNADESEETNIYENIDTFDSYVSEKKTNIVLQPGKKWERSLSIYRRMTMMNDPINHTILDEEDLHLKGRKYRQSVIHTMELQDKGYLLYLTKLLIYDIQTFLINVFK